MLHSLVSLADQIGPLNVFRYIAFRTGGAIMTALLFVFLFGPAIIDLLRLKQGASTTGRLIILLAITGSTLLWINSWTTHAWIALATLWLAASSNAMDRVGRLSGQLIKPAMLLVAVAGIAAYLCGNSVVAEGLHIRHIPGLAEVAVVCGAIVGAGFACLLSEDEGCSIRW
jgi:hypothetical protein